MSTATPAIAGLLADVSRLFASAPDARELIAGLARAAVPDLGDWCVVNVFDVDRGVHGAASHHADATLQPVLDELRERYPADPHSSTGVGRALRTGEPVLVAAIDDAYLRRIARDGRHYELLRMLEPKSAMYVPIVAEEASIGVVTLGSARTTYGPRDVRAAMELARRAALGLDNVRLQDAARAADEKRKQAEADLAAGERSFRALFAANPLPMWVYDVETLRFVEVNRAAITHYGYSRRDFRRMTILDIRPPEEAARLRDHLGLIDDIGVRTAGIWRHRKQDGTLIDVLVRSHALKVRGRASVLAVAEDVTERLAAERALKLLNEELEARVAARTAELEAANRELEAFSYSVSHDLRSPLRSMDGFSQALLEDYSSVLDDTGRDYLRRIRGAAQRMGSLIDDLLRLSRVTRTDLHHDAVDLSRIASEVVRTLQEQNPARRVEVVIAPELVVMGDRHLLGHVMENLISNAWKFTGRVAEPRIEVGRTMENGKSVLFVRDNGAGFSMEYAHKLFHVFQRLHAMSEFEGTGVGLAIVNRVLQRHGGRIWANATPGEGATFYFELP